MHILYNVLSLVKKERALVMLQPQLHTTLMLTPQVHGALVDKTIYLLATFIQLVAAAL
jgi:hypothetical protein